ncbi:zinc ribbon domain-containing protein [Marinihelvus fidelis]|uniref:Zinc ribbon domain-containing protein n=1 Tax=Marinihelvus fidelis TaxID=2613842 RepID=A0A5N0TI16_9GAMM|nr:zinc ribbon domain-containing protein [Marinihelvus fidelis]KAA9133506.1 zinc ribbon domain-containing protein [Marinihelvus fidelis]
MPIYEYRCEGCGHELEKLQRMSDDPLRDCPECGQAQLKRLISAAGFRLKGGGWYETDFKSDNKRNLADSGNDKPKSGSSDAGKTPKTEKKTASKTEAKSA